MKNIFSSTADNARDLFSDFLNFHAGAVVDVCRLKLFMIWPSTQRRCKHLNRVQISFTISSVRWRTCVRTCSSVCSTVDERRVVAGLDGGVKLQSAATHPVFHSVAAYEVVAEKQLVTLF